MAFVCTWHQKYKQLSEQLDKKIIDVDFYLKELSTSEHYCQDCINNECTHFNNRRLNGVFYGRSS